MSTVFYCACGAHLEGASAHDAHVCPHVCPIPHCLFDQYDSEYGGSICNAPATGEIAGTGGKWPPGMNGPYCTWHGDLVMRRAPILDPAATVEFRRYADERPARTDEGANPGGVTRRMGEDDQSTPDTAR